MWTGTNSKDLKIQNRLLVRNLIRRFGPIARYEIAQETGLTPSTVTVITAELLEAGVIREAGHGESTGGRRPVLLELNPTAAHVFTVQLQRGEATAAMFGITCNSLAEHTYHLDTDTPDEVVETIGLCFEQLVREADIDPDTVLWCGVACPGLVSSDRGVVERSSNLGWLKVPLGEMIGRRLGGMPVHVENISNAAALAEKEYGLGRGYSDLVFVNLSVGVSAGILVNGEIYGGVQGYAGEIGHVSYIPENGPRCACGRRGCFEAVCSARAVLERIKAAVGEEEFAQYGLSKDTVKLRELLNSPLVKSEAVQRVVEETGHAVGILVANLVNLLNPRIIILGGELSAFGAPLLRKVEEEVKLRSLEELHKSSSIQLSNLRGAGPLLGAYALALEKVFSLEEWAANAAVRV
ncbi:MAG: ROK family transcriptional regulator [Firmicutes bacterium]|nr:ROK family transcriptional regulator [Bacillota bacterium]